MAFLYFRKQLQKFCALDVQIFLDFYNFIVF